MSHAPARQRPRPAAIPGLRAAPLPPHVTAALAAFTGAALLLCVTFPIFDSDLWQHLLVGKVIWTTHSIPSTQLWTWPTYGAPDVLPSWIFRALLWPVWSAAGVTGLFAWRWVTTLACFALLWRTARRMGARGAFAFFALFWCALFYRYRAVPRPESLVAILMAAQLYVLESRRGRPAGAAGVDPAWALAPIALVWANLHLSYWVGFALSAFYFADTFVPGRSGLARERRGTLVLAVLACVAVSFVNPAGWRTLAQPFEYWFVWRHEPIYKIIGELGPVNWAVFSKSLLPLWLPALGLLALRRWRRHGFDLAQALVLALFIPQALSTQRFLSYAAVLVAPFFARDLDQWLAESDWPRALCAPWAQAALAASLSAVAWLPTLTDSAIRPGFGLRYDYIPVGACDWMRDHDVRGHGFHPFEMGGYLLYRFWPDKTRLPFMDIHQAGTTEDRALAALALVQPTMLARLDGKYRFEWMMLSTIEYPAETILATVDADTTTWALVYRDDAAALFLRRDGAYAALAARERYRVMCAARSRRPALLARCQADPTLRAELRTELARAAAAAPRSADAPDALAYLDLVDGRTADARRHLAQAGALNPTLFRLHERTGLAWLMEGHAQEALGEFEAEKRQPVHTALADLRIAQALQALGRREQAVAAYRKALAVPETQAQARDSLAALGAGPGGR